MKRRILIDCDGVMADFTTTFLAILALQTGRVHSVEDITSFHFEKCICSAAEAARVWDAIRLPNVVLGIPRVADLDVSLARLRALGEVICVTSPVWGSPWANERFQWLEVHEFTSKSVVFASRKELIGGDALIDDATHNLDAWRSAHPRGYAVLTDQPWNRDGLHPRVVGLAGAATYLETMAEHGHF